LSPISAHTLYLHTCPNASSTITLYYYYYWDYYTITRYSASLLAWDELIAGGEIKNKIIKKRPAIVSVLKAKILVYRYPMGFHGVSDIGHPSQRPTEDSIGVKGHS